MLDSAPPDLSIFANKVRVRVCGLLRNEDSLLMIRHRGIGPKKVLWSPPGGGVAFGETVIKTLKREFLEETNLEIEVLKFLFLNEFIDQNLHAVELFFEVKEIGGKLALGVDPELSEANQILEDIRYLRFNDIDNMDVNTLHNIFNEVKFARDIFNLNGICSFKL